MANPWPPPYNQHHHIPSSSDTPSQAGQRTAARPNAYAAIQGCFCSWCSATTRNDPPVWGTTEYQNPWLPRDPAILFMDQNLGANNLMGTAAPTNGQTQALQVPTPSTPDDPGPAGQWQDATRPDTNTAIQDCRCSLCSDNSPQIWRTMGQQDSSLLCDPTGPGINNPTGIVPIVSDQTWARERFGTQQAPWNLENAGYAPPNDGAGPHQAPVPESLRRLSGNHISNLDARVNAVRLEPGPSPSGFRVVITLEIDGIML